MTTIIILTVVFIIMIIAPILGAWLYYLNTDGVILHIKQDMVKDPRYFSHSFTGMIKRALPGIKGNTLKLSREEHFLKSNDLLMLNLTDKGGEVDEMVLAIDEPMIFPDKAKTYNKEIYATQNVAVDKPGITLRAIYSAEKMYLGNKTTIVRWADAEFALSVYDDCDLGMAATSGHILTLGKNVKFRRLYAPMIYFGQYPSMLIDPMEGRNELTFMLPIIHEKKKEKHVTNEKLTKEGTAPYSIVTTKTMVVEDAVLQGDIHTDGSVRICEGAGVLGNIFAEKGILIEKGAFVMGNVFSQGKIEIRPNVMIGKEGRIVSVIARDRLTIGENVVIFGYVTSETQGVCCPIYDSEEPRFSGTYEFANFEEETLDVTFASIEEYDLADGMAYRQNLKVVTAVLPEGITVLKRSMFCDCKNLVRMTIPDSIKEIEDYSLMGCTALKDISSFENTKLERIGVSGLENCDKIETLHFPETITELNGAACAGMTELKEVTFPENCNLKILGDHAFRGCSKLTSVMLPDSVEKVGRSTFRDCTGLKNLSVSEKIKDEPGIEELGEILPELKVEYRQGDDSEET